ncbi:MAG: 3-deoxy-manno-octulosonate cytidylyltransferase [Alphaproteobacteria bacterium]|jgi:3-deoxy-manno-octulosonate cytidylyltransferase (CMP-KDO synthetase)|nr:3-deoxy-manno-octulosonate cytidylyltransferase [Alphaproteobacteria bacterium]MBT5390122.1 3-deoxy-manno-octulosonate cytidylyltransferase [Alphaproteobacteria bacterium]MBT5540885.1 3-deoxy-manno-octulosonate cytidylyltransferase [Alphaproteobacteria bacterium]MBT5654755.1 3-deoxy-manno-octulosonate cytidylyltransferase [Alphaproteobacteria bacterium]
MTEQTLIVIPARLQATRLPNKPLADICGKPMIVRVWEQAQASQVGEVVVACGEPEIKEVVERSGGQAVLTDPNLPSGTDRVWAAVETLDPSGKYSRIINVQGDLPTLDPTTVSRILGTLSNPAIDISTPVCPFTDEEEINNPNVVKAVLSLKEGDTEGRALYFSRSPIPHGMRPLYYHIGLYAFQREALERFVSLPQTALEKAERLEQLRALEAGMTIQGVLVDSIPVGVDTPEDLEKARSIVAKQDHAKIA